MSIADGEHGCLFPIGTHTANNKWLLLNPTERDEFSRRKAAGEHWDTIKADIEKDGLDTVTLEYEVRNIPKKRGVGNHDYPFLLTNLKNLNI